MQWLLRSTILVLLAMALNGCIFAIPFLIHYYWTPSEYIATAEVAVSAEKVYAAVVRNAEAAGPGIKIVNRDDAARLLEINHGVQTATIKVIEESGREETQIIVSASRVAREEQEELALQVLLHLCKDYGQECSIMRPRLAR